MIVYGFYRVRSNVSRVLAHDIVVNNFHKNMVYLYGWGELVHLRFGNSTLAVRI